jgi:hypothetical protein
MLYGKKAIKQDESKSLTTFEGLVLLDKVDKNRAGKGMLAMRSDLLEVGLEVIAPDANEIKSRRGRIKEVYGSEKVAKVWKTYKNNLEAIEEGLRAAAACIVLVATIERGKEGTFKVYYTVKTDYGLSRHKLRLSDDKKYFNWSNRQKVEPSKGQITLYGKI